MNIEGGQVEDTQKELELREMLVNHCAQHLLLSSYDF